MMKCPRCNQLLGYVQAPAYLNRDQWAAVSPGDYFAAFCLSDGECLGQKGNSGYFYFHKAGIEAAHDEEAVRKDW